MGLLAWAESRIGKRNIVVIAAFMLEILADSASLRQSGYFSKFLLSHGHPPHLCKHIANILFYPDFQAKKPFLNVFKRLKTFTYGSKRLIYD